MKTFIAALAAVLFLTVMADAQVRYVKVCGPNGCRLVPYNAMPAADGPTVAYPTPVAPGVPFFAPHQIADKPTVAAPANLTPLPAAPALVQTVEPPLFVGPVASVTAATPIFPRLHSLLFGSSRGCTNCGCGGTCGRVGCRCH